LARRYCFVGKTRVMYLTQQDRRKVRQVYAQRMDHLPEALSGFIEQSKAVKRQLEGKES
jgi:hypothetical protein